MALGHDDLEKNLKTRQISQFLNEEYCAFKKPISIQIIQENLNFQYAKLSNSLVSAFMHKSFKHENSLELDHNEKLEFLGIWALLLLALILLSAQLLLSQFVRN